MEVKYKVHTLENLQEINLSNIPFQELDNCPICGTNRWIDVAVLRNSLTSSWCKHCKHLFLRRKPTEDWYKIWYTSKWDTVHFESNKASEGRMLKFKRHAKNFIKELIGYRPPIKSIHDFCKNALDGSEGILDVGCGYGAYLIPFKKAGHPVYGIELSQHRLAAAKRLGVETAMIGVEDLSEDTFGRKFDLVFSNHVLEHVHNPHIFLEKIKSILKPNGWFFVAVPNVENYFLPQDFFFALHVHSFTHHSLAALVKEHGFEIHRYQQDHELRILARLRSGTPGSEAIDNIISENDYELSANWIYSKLFGKTFRENLGKTVYAKAFTVPSPIKVPYNMSFSNSLMPLEKKTIEFKVPDAVVLPLEFTCELRSGDAPFWIK